MSVSCGESSDFLFWKDLSHLRDMFKLCKWFKALTQSGEDIEERVHNISGQTSGPSSRTPTHLIIEADHLNVEYYYTLATLEMVRADEKSVYPACPDCKKRMEKNMDEAWD